MRKVRWTTEASDQLVAIVKRIQEDNPSAARNVAQTVIDRIEDLATFPALGRLGEVNGTANRSSRVTGNHHQDSEARSASSAAAGPTSSASAIKMRARSA